MAAPARARCQTDSSTDVTFLHISHPATHSVLPLLTFQTGSKVIGARLGERVSFDRFERSFSREDEVKSFEEAATFLQQQGFAVLRFANGVEPIADAVATLANSILMARA